MRFHLAFAAALAVSPLAATAQTVLSGDHSVDGELCVGVDCTNSETLLADNTIKLKANNVAIYFEDTSVDPFTTNDWRIRINEQSGGGDPSFVVQDFDTGNQIFKLRAGARPNSLFVDSDGDVGLGTQSPNGSLHIVDGLANRVILETDGSGGGSPGTWALTSNGGAFQIDSPTGAGAVYVTSASTSDTLVIHDQSVGISMNFSNPTSTLTVGRPSAGPGDTQVLVQETNAATTPRTLMNLQNNGRPEIVMGNTATGGEWSFGAGTNFILKQGAVGTASSAKTKLFEIGPTGDATLTGSLTTGGTTCGGGCDLVFTENRVIPAADYAAAMWNQGHLPHVGPTPEGAPLNVSEKLGGMLNALEHAHVFIDEQRAEIARLKARVEALESEPDSDRN